MPLMKAIGVPQLRGHLLAESTFYEAIVLCKIFTVWSFMTAFRAFFFCVMICGSVQTADAATNGVVEFLHKIDRQLCANFKSVKCKQGKRQKAVSTKSKQKIEKPITVPKSADTSAIPKPSLKPELPAPHRVAAVVPRMKPVKAAPAATVTKPIKLPEKTVEKLPANAACFAALKVMGVDFEPVAPPSGGPSCIVTQPVLLKSVHMSGVDLQMPDHPILNCAFALHFLSWLQELGGPAASAKEGFALTQFYTGPGYVCRGRNGDISSKISEHGSGNAVDVERMKFSDGQVFEVHDALNPLSKAYETLKAIRASACTRFTTVLGPGSNAAHREHFHFDLGTHGKSGTYRICE
jgi:hypothetical protein